MPTPLERAEQVQQDRARQMEAIRNDANLSTLGKQRRIYDLHIATAGQLAQLRAERAKHITDEQTRLNHAAFAAPSTADQPAYRDALERADRLDTPRAVEAALERAARTDDTLYARAIRAVAGERGWAAVIVRHGELFGGSDEFDALEDFGLAVRDPQRRMAEDMVFSAAPPADLQGYRPPAEADA